MVSDACPRCLGVLQYPTMQFECGHFVCVQCATEQVSVGKIVCHATGCKHVKECSNLSSLARNAGSQSIPGESGNQQPVHSQAGSPPLGMVHDGVNDVNQVTNDVQHGSSGSVPLESTGNTVYTVDGLLHESRSVADIPATVRPVRSISVPPGLDMSDAPMPPATYSRPVPAPRVQSHVPPRMPTTAFGPRFQMPIRMRLPARLNSFGGSLQQLPSFTPNPSLGIANTIGAKRLRHNYASSSTSIRLPTLRIPSQSESPETKRLDRHATPPIRAPANDRFGFAGHEGSPSGAAAGYLSNAGVVSGPASLASHSDEVSGLRTSTPVEGQGMDLADSAPVRRPVVQFREPVHTSLVVEEKSPNSLIEDCAFSCGNFCQVIVRGGSNQIYLQDDAMVISSGGRNRVRVTESLDHKVPERQFTACQALFVGSGCTIVAGEKCRLLLQGQGNSVSLLWPGVGGSVGVSVCD